MRTVIIPQRLNVCRCNHRAANAPITSIPRLLAKLLSPDSAVRQEIIVVGPERSAEDHFSFQVQAPVGLLLVKIM